ncbi:MAG: hypothetical protein EPO28_15475 [Saprospiraceae bacterium]|nr:MAG: hypothetical protein EPO28_15475 [Saprospiraceae bacterium]
MPSLYNFQARLHKHKVSHGLNPDGSGQYLPEQTFQQLTKGKLRRFKIDGKDVRIDSKLINSNIAKSNRLQLVIGTIGQFFKGLPQAQLPDA